MDPSSAPLESFLQAIEVVLDELDGSPDSLWDFETRGPWKAAMRDGKAQNGQSAAMQTRLDDFCFSPVAAGNNLTSSASL